MARILIWFFAVALSLCTASQAAQPTAAERSLFKIERAKVSAIHEVYFPAIRDLGIAAGRLTALRKTDFRREEAMKLARKALAAHAGVADELDELVAGLHFSKTSSEDFNEKVDILLEVMRRSPDTVRRLHGIATGALEAAQDRDVERLTSFSAAFSKLGTEQNEAEIELIRVDRLLLTASNPARGLALTYIGSLEGLNAFASIGTRPPGERLRALLALPSKIDSAVDRIEAGIAEAREALVEFEKATEDLGGDQIINGVSLKSVKDARRGYAAAVEVQLAVERDMRDLFASSADLARRLADGEKSRDLNDALLAFDPAYAKLIERRVDAAATRERAGDLMRSREN